MHLLLHKLHKSDSYLRYLQSDRVSDAQSLCSNHAASPNAVVKCERYPVGMLSLPTPLQIAMPALSRINHYANSFRSQMLSLLVSYSSFLQHIFSNHLPNRTLGASTALQNRSAAQMVIGTMKRLPKMKPELYCHPFSEPVMLHAQGSIWYPMTCKTGPCMR